MKAGDRVASGTAPATSKDSEPLERSGGFDSPRFYTFAEAAKLQIRPTGVSDLPHFGGSVFDCERRGEGFMITRTQVAKLAMGETRALSAAELATMRIRDGADGDGRSEHPMFAGSVFLCERLPVGRFEVTRLPELQMPFDSPMHMTTDEVMALRIHPDGKSARLDLRASRFEAAMLGPNRYLVTRRLIVNAETGAPTPRLPPRGNKYV